MAGRLHNRPSTVLVAIWILVACGSAVAPAQARDLDVKEMMRFAAEMAGLGNWREARYRWELIAEARPDNANVLNNLAVANEALGDLDVARTDYEQALVLSHGEPRIVDNYKRFQLFVRQLEIERTQAARAGADAGGEASAADTESSADEQDSAAGAAGDAAAAAESPDEAADDSTVDRRTLAAIAADPSKKSGKVDKVTVSLPVPAKLDVGNRKTLLVASFLTSASALLDTNRELVRVLRGEFRKRTDLEVLDIVPPPAVPEQTVEDLLTNSEFWKDLARRYGADIIVSGAVDFSRKDVSGFRDVDTVSSVTGQKVRQTNFVEQEQFDYLVDVFYIDGATGTLMFRDRVSRAVIFRDMNNDPITAFYEMSDSIALDVLSVIIPRNRVDTRQVFRNG